MNNCHKQMGFLNKPYTIPEFAWRVKQERMSNATGQYLSTKTYDADTWDMINRTIPSTSHSFHSLSTLFRILVLDDVYPYLRRGSLFRPNPPVPSRRDWGWY